MSPSSWTVSAVPSKLFPNEALKSVDESVDGIFSFRLYPHRWLVLFIFSGLSFLNNVVCYSFAPIHSTTWQLFHELSNASLKPSLKPSPNEELPYSIHISDFVSAFFITYVLFSFPSSYIVDKFGLQLGVQVGAWLQAIGCGTRMWAMHHCLHLWHQLQLLRSHSVDPLLAGDPQIHLQRISDQSCDSFYLLYIGQLITSLGQAFFVNPPPLLAELWFGPDERTFATTVAVNANILGIAGAYVIAPLMVHTFGDIPHYVSLIFYLSLAFALLTLCCFPPHPPSPPSLSSHYHSNEGLQLQISWGSILSLFRHVGFLYPLLAFALTEATINGLSAFMNSLLVPQGFTEQFIGIQAVVFIVVAMVGSAVCGWVVDRLHNYKLMIILCFVGTALSMVFFIYSGSSSLWVTLSICGIGLFIGPLQPLTLETAVECTFPSSSSTVSSLLQVFGNLASAALFPAMVMMKSPDGKLTPALWALAIAQIVIAFAFVFFRGKYLRILHESRGIATKYTENGGEAIESDKKSTEALLTHVDGVEEGTSSAAPDRNMSNGYGSLDSASNSSSLP